MSRLTIVIPWFGASEPFEQTLVSVLQNRPVDCDVLVVHADPYSDPYDIGQEVQLIEAPGATSACELLNLAFTKSESEWIHVLACGCEVAEGWTAGASQHFDSPRTSVVAPLVLESGAPGARIVAAGSAWSWGGSCRRVAAGRRLRAGRAPRGRIQGAAWEAGFYRRRAVLDAGGFDPKVGDQFAPLDLALTLAQLNQQVELAADSQVYRAADSAASSFTAGLQAERLFWRHAGETGGGSLAPALALHAAAVAALSAGRLFRKGGLLEVAGRLAGTLEFGTRARQRRRVERCRSVAEEEPATFKVHGDASEATGQPRELDTPSDYGSRRAA